VEVLKYFDWLGEWEKIKAFIDSNEDIKREQKEQVLRAFTTYDTLFDLNTIKSYLTHSELNMRQDESSKFSLVLKENKRRVVKYYDSRIQDFRFDHKVNGDLILSEGFNKICGLRGSFLSGG